MSRPTAITLCQQAGRHASAALLGMDFAESFESTEGKAVFARTIPQRDRRADVALSFTALPSPVPVDASPVVTQYVQVLCRASDAESALRILADVRESFRPGGHPFTDPLAYGTIGTPPVEALGAGQEAAAWRVTGVELLAEPEPVSLGVGDSASPRGEGEAQMRLAFRVLPVTLADVGGVTLEAGAVGASISGTTVGLLLEANSASTAVTFAGRSIAEVFASISAAPGFVAQLDNVSRGAAPSRGAILGFQAITQPKLDAGVRLRAVFAE